MVFPDSRCHLLLNLRGKCPSFTYQENADINNVEIGISATDMVQIHFNTANALFQIVSRPLGGIARAQMKLKRRRPNLKIQIAGTIRPARNELGGIALPSPPPACGTVARKVGRKGINLPYLNRLDYCGS